MWLQRKFSKNHTFTLRNYLINALLYYVHLCMKGKDKLVPGELYLGTSKAAEGYGAELAFEVAKMTTFTLKYIGRMVTHQLPMLFESFS